MTGQETWGGGLVTLMRRRADKESICPPFPPHPTKRGTQSWTEQRVLIPTEESLKVQ